MNSKLLCDTIDLVKRDYSLLVINPREAFLDWLKAFAKLKGLEKYRLYVPEENAILIIPKLDRFSEPGSLELFLSDIKPKLLRAELSRFSASPEDLGYPLSRETFDAFFEVVVRDSAMFISDLG